MPRAIGQYRELWAKEQAIRAAEAKADDLPRVKLTTTKGDIVIELFENEAPQAVGQLHHAGQEGLLRRRGVSSRAAACSWPRAAIRKGDGSGGPGYTIRCECYQPNYRHHFRGSLSMAHAGRDTGGSQFFLTFVPTPHLDGKHTVFGRVIEGMEVLGELQKRNPRGASRCRLPTGSSRPKCSAIAGTSTHSRSCRAADSRDRQFDRHVSLLQDQPIVPRDEQPVLLAGVLNEHDPLAVKQVF